MCYIAKRNFKLASISWITLIGFVIFVEPSPERHSRLIVFFAIAAFWYWFSLCFRRKWIKPSSGHKWYGVYYLGKSWHWEDVVSFQVFLLPFSFISIYGLIFAGISLLNFQLSLVITIVLWMFFFLLESAHSQGQLFSTFDFSELNWFTVAGIVIDLIGIILSIMQMSMSN